MIEINLHVLKALHCYFLYEKEGELKRFPENEEELIPLLYGRGEITIFYTPTLIKEDYVRSDTKGKCYRIEKFELRRIVKKTSELINSISQMRRSELKSFSVGGTLVVHPFNLVEEAANILNAKLANFANEKAYVSLKNVGKYQKKLV